MIRNLNLGTPLNLIENDYLEYIKANEYEYGLYVVTNDGYIDETGTSPRQKEGGDNTLGDIQRMRIARHIDNYILSKVYYKDIPVLRFRISRDPALAYAIKRANIQLFEADNKTGFMDMPYQHGLDLEIAKDDLDAVVVPKIVHDTLFKAGLLVKRYGRRIIPENLDGVGY